jgi:glycine C-acetyltransferase
MFEHELDSLKSGGLYRELRTMETGHGPRVTVGGREMLSLASNDYLGLACHRALRDAACAAVQRYGTGSGASRLLSGSSPLHARLEEALAAFLGCEAVLLFNSGYAANTGVLGSLCDAGDLILSDALNHASIVDGCRLSKADVMIYKHCDMNNLEKLLKVNSGYRRRWVATEGVFSMDGDVAPLDDLVGLAKKYGAEIYLDDAHGIGVLGERGQGTASRCGVEGRLTLRMGTLGKAFGSYGAYVGGRREIIDLLINRARSLIFSTALPPSVLAASAAALEIIRGPEGDSLRARLGANVQTLVSGLRAAGCFGITGETPITPLILGPVSTALAVAQRLFAEGVFAPAIRPPTVPEGTARIRFSVMASHGEAELARVGAILKTIRDEGTLLSCGTARHDG